MLFAVGLDFPGKPCDHIPCGPTCVQSALRLREFDEGLLANNPEKYHHRREQRVREREKEKENGTQESMSIIMHQIAGYESNKGTKRSGISAAIRAMLLLKMQLQSMGADGGIFGVALFSPLLPFFLGSRSTQRRGGGNRKTWRTASSAILLLQMTRESRSEFCNCSTHTLFPFQSK